MKISGPMRNIETRLADVATAAEPQAEPSAPAAVHPPDSSPASLAALSVPTEPGIALPATETRRGAATDRSALPWSRGLRATASEAILSLLNRDGLRGALGLLSTLYLNLRHPPPNKSFAPVRISYDGDGKWLHHCGSWAILRDRPVWQRRPESDPELVAEFSRIRNEQHFDYSPQAGGTVVIVSAGGGLDALLNARLVGASGSVIAIEAHPRQFRMLERTAAVNPMLSIHPVHAAIVDRERTVSIEDGPKWDANQVRDDSEAGGNRIHGIPGRTLDQIVAEREIGEIDLLVVDIEGAEAIALEGMRSTLARSRQVMFECHDFRADWGEGEHFRTKADVEAALREHGFSIRYRNAPKKPWLRDTLYARR